MTYHSRDIKRMALDNLFGLATQQPIMEARRCGPQRASQIVGEVVHAATGHAFRHRAQPAVIAFLLAQQELRYWEDTPEAFYWHERNLGKAT